MNLRLQIRFAIFTAIIMLFIAQNASAQVGIGTSNPDNSAMLDVTSTTKGFLAPRVTSVQRNLIPSPATGLLVYDKDSTCFFYYTGLAWKSLKNSTQTSYTAGTGITISGASISAQNTTAQWNANKLNGKSISSTTPTSGQVLKYNGYSWVPGTDSTGSGSTYTGGTGITVSGTSIAAQNTTAQWNANKLSGSSVSSTAPSTSGQVLKWNGTSWAPGTDSSNAYTAGTGISISSNTINSNWTTSSNNIYNNNSAT